MPSKTRSHAVSTKPGVSTVINAKDSTSDPMTLLFRREVQTMLTIAPPNVDPDTPVKVLAAIERLSLSGTQQSLQLCEAGNERWVTRTEGDRCFFPRLGRVNKQSSSSSKRLREEDIDEEDDLDVVIETPKAKASSKGTSKKHKHHKKSKDAPPAPQPLRRSRRGTTPPPSVAATETSVGSAESIRLNVEEALSRGKGKRRCVGRDAEERAYVGEAASVDDLESLCGRVDTLDVQSLAAGKCPSAAYCIRCCSPIRDSQARLPRRASRLTATPPLSLDRLYCASSRDCLDSLRLSTNMTLTTT